MNKNVIALLLTNVMACPVTADVFNKSQKTIYLKAESSAQIFSLKPGQTYKGQQDGLVVPDAHVGHVFKVVDNINVTVEKNFSIDTFASLYSSPIDKIQATIEQALVGGWKDKQFIKNHPDWIKLFKQSTL
jgi:hypothetical protein